MIDVPIKSPFNDYLGMQFLRTADNGLEVRLPIRAELLNSAGIVHGGVYASLGDVALSAAIHARVVPQQMAITVEMSCRYLRGARAGVLCALGRVVHLGKRIVVAEADIRVDGDIAIHHQRNLHADAARRAGRWQPGPGSPMRVITFNANGIRSAASKGFFVWLEAQQADVVCVQETRARIDQLNDGHFFPDGYHCYYFDAERPGYAGTAVYTRREPQACRSRPGLGADRQRRALASGRFCRHQRGIALHALGQFG